MSYHITQIPSLIKSLVLTRIFFPKVRLIRFPIYLIGKKFINFGKGFTAGRITRKKVYSYYEKVDALIFPSKLETWGLPVSEFKDFNKPIFISNIAYAKETINGYSKVKYFDPNNPLELSILILEFLNNNLIYSPSKKIELTNPFANDWDELFQILLEKKDK